MALWSPQHRNEQHTEHDRRCTADERQVIEGVISQLKDFFGLERHRAKTLPGLLTCLAAKIVAYTCGQLLKTLNLADRCVTSLLC